LVFAYDLVPRFLEMQSNTYHVLQEMGTNVYEVIRETLGREKVTLDPATGCDFTGLDSLVNSPMYHDLILLVNDSRLYAHKVLFSLFPYILQTYIEPMRCRQFYSEGLHTSVPCSRDGHQVLLDHCHRLLH
jgi:hypothetical protein